MVKQRSDSSTSPTNSSSRSRLARFFHRPSPRAATAQHWEKAAPAKAGGNGLSQPVSELAPEPVSELAPEPVQPPNQPSDRSFPSQPVRVAGSPTRETDAPLEERSKPSPRPTAPKPKRSWSWTLLCFVVLGIISGMGSAALLWLVSLPPPPNCSSPDELTLDMERLYCAQQSVQSGGLPELIAGLEMLKQWTSEDPLYAETQELAEDWSKQVLSIARSMVQEQDDLQGALDAISHIPQGTQAYQEAQDFAAYWQEQWQEGEAIYNKAQTALKQQDWLLASEQVAAMAELSNSYWNTRRANELAQQLGAEKRAWQVLVRARNAAAGGSPTELGQGITIAQELPPDSYAWEAARPNLQQWSQSLVQLGIQKWQAGDWQGAVSVLAGAPQKTSVPELQDLMWFGNAYKLASSSQLSSAPSSNWFPTPEQVWQLMEAVAALKQVKPDSPFYQQAQTTQQNFAAQLQDMIQLQSATLLAKLGQRSTLQLAIEQAQQVGIDRPRRLQAQTLLAHWTEEIERIEDQPYLDYAIALAEAGQIQDLKAAIAEASQIPQGRALRNTAQGWIATWTNRIEQIEDQPILNQAWALADAGQLGEAVEIAQTILRGRALYEEAQSAIYDWQAQITRNNQLAEDRPILNRARSLADSGDLSGAIRVASQISSRRVLYSEAQGLIADWQARLNPTPQWWEEEDTTELDEDKPPEEKQIDELEDIDGSSSSPSPVDPSSADPVSPGLENPTPPILFPPPPVLPPRIETVPPPIEAPSPPIIEDLPPAEGEIPLLEDTPEATPEEETSDSGASRSSFEGYYDQRYYENP